MLDVFARMGAALHGRLANAAASIGPRAGVQVIYRRRPQGVLLGAAAALSSAPSVTCPTEALDPATARGADVYVTTDAGTTHWEVCGRLDDADTGLTRLDLTEPATP